MRDLSHLLPWETTWVAYQKDKYLRRYQQQFIDLLDEMILKRRHKIRLNPAAGAVSRHPDCRQATSLTADDPACFAKLPCIR